jgi:DNA-binding CsgD family transcriptional regulator
MRLSPRESECVRLLAKGLSDRAVSRKLGISHRTVRFHIDNAKEKLEASNRCHLVAVAIKLAEIAA